MSTQFQNANKIKFMPLPYIDMFDLDVIYQTSDAELLYQVLFKLNEIAKSQNIVIDNFQKVLDWATCQIEKFTKEQLEEWLNDGTFESIINEKLFPNLNQRRWNVLYPPNGYQPLVNDGVTDNTNQLQALINAGLPLFFPEGTYAFNGLVSTQSEDNVDIVGLPDTIIHKNDVASYTYPYIWDFHLSKNIYMKNFYFDNSYCVIYYDFNAENILEYYNNYKDSNITIDNVLSGVNTTTWKKFITTKRPETYERFESSGYASYPLEIINQSGYNAINITNIALDDSNGTPEIQTVIDNSAIGIIDAVNSGTPTILVDLRGSRDVFEILNRNATYYSGQKDYAVFGIGQTGNVAVGCLPFATDTNAPNADSFKAYSSTPSLGLYYKNSSGDLRQFRIYGSNYSDTFNITYNGNIILQYDLSHLHLAPILMLHLQSATLNTLNGWLFFDNLNYLRFASTSNTTEPTTGLHLLRNHNSSGGQSRPQNLTNSYNDIGFMWFDSVTKRPQWWSGTGWVYADGTSAD